MIEHAGEEGPVSSQYRLLQQHIYRQDVTNLQSSLIDT